MPRGCLLMWGAFSRADWLDVFTMSSKRPSIAEPDYIGPLDELRMAAANIGVRVLDLREHDRTVDYRPKDRCEQDGHDFGAWGYFRGDEPKKNVPKRAKSRGVIPWEKLTGIMLHITAVKMAAPRFLGTPVQTGISDSGDIVLCHPINAKLWHGHAANSFTCGIEVSSKSGEISGVQGEALRALIRYIHDERQENHRGQMVIMGHRQSHRSRVNDPGPDVWHAGAEWAINELGIKVGPVVGSGKDIPAEWREPWVSV